MLNESIFSIPKMDCASEERLVRMQLDSVPGVKGMRFDLSGRTMTIQHIENPSVLLEALKPLGFGAALVSTSRVMETVLPPNEADAEEGRVLKKLLAINAGMFVVELVAGLIAQSTGLIADSLDMFADAAVYGLSLYAVGKLVSYKRRAARFSGYIQLLLAVMALSEVARRYMYGAEPNAPYMIAVAFVALIANVSCMALLAKHREGAVHMKASWIFSTNDVIANIGVIIAGVLVYFTKAGWPDLVIGTIIAVVVLRGAVSILRISSAK